MVPLKITERNRQKSVKKSILNRIIAEKKSKLKELRGYKRSNV